MKIKYECEANEDSYIERVFSDGIMIYESIHERTNYGTKQISPQSLEEAADNNEIMELLYEDMPTFLGMSLIKIAEEFS